jgi:raffinose/stachyose/melibiose transport system permease protein
LVVAALGKGGADMSMMMRKAGRLVQNVILLLFSLSCVFPVIWLFGSSLKERTEFYHSPLALPKNPSFQHYINILTESQIGAWMTNSVRNSVISLVFIVLFSFVMGYFLARFRFRGRNMLYGYLLLGMLIPVHALMVPMYVLFTKTGLTDQWFTLVLPYVALGLPIGVFLVESYVHSIPQEIEEAAAIDGCSFHRMLFAIIAPMCKPILVTVGIIQFFNVWNEFTFSLILIDSEKWMTVPVGITLFRGQFSTDYPRMMTAMLVAILPAMLLYFIFSRQIIKGMVAGAVKG